MRNWRRLSGLIFIVATFLSISVMLVDSGVSAATPKDTLIVAAPDTPQNLDVNKSVHPASQEIAVGSLYEPLWEYSMVEVDGIFEPDFTQDMEPRLAESWSVSEDGRTWTINLRKGVYSAAGNELTAEDVKWTWDRIWNTKGLGIFYYNTFPMNGPDDIKVVDRYTVTFTTGRPSPMFIHCLQQFGTVIFDSTEVKKHTSATDPWAEEWLKTNTAGFGPYKIDSWSPGQQMVLTAVEGHYRQPSIERIVYRSVPSSSNRLSFLMQGVVDIALNLSPEEIKRLENEQDISVLWKSGGSRFASLIFNQKSAPFDNVLVRKAIAYAVPYEQIVTSVYHGRAEQMKAPFPGYTLYRNEELSPYLTDPARAKELLAEAGYADGFSTELIYSGDIPEAESIAILVRTYLSQVGIDVTLTKLPATRFAERQQAKDFAIELFFDQPVAPHPGYAAYLYYGTDSLVNYIHYSNPRIDQLISEGLGTVDEEAQRAIWTEVQQILLDDCPWVWLVEPGYTVAVRSNVKGATWYPLNLLQWADFGKE